MVSLKRSAFELDAESRPSKRARASSADGDVRDAAAANIDKDPTTPRRDPSPDLQRPSTIDLPTRPHAVFDDSEHPRPEGQYHRGSVPNSNETASIRSTSSGRDKDPYMDESVFDDRDDMPSIADRRNLVSNAAAACVAIPQSPRVAVLDEGNTPEDTGFDQGYEAASAASWDVVALYDSENLDCQPEVQYQPTDAEDELTESYETKSTGSTSVTSAAGWDVLTLYDSENLDRQPKDQYHPTDAEDELEEDEFEFTDGYETESRGSTSATPSVYNDYTFENGRRYQNFKNGYYPIPNDDEELNREDMKHAMLMELCDGQLFHAPIDDQPHMILDIGTGSGIWAIEVGDQYPTARVRGIDLSPTQPIWVPPNVEFLVDDCEQGEWLDKDVDFVHFRFMTIVLKDVAGVLERAYESLKPGGWVELQELSAEILCDDNTMPDNDPVKYMYELVQRAFEKFGMNVTVPKDLEDLLCDAGFKNIQCVVKKVPIGPWARDKTLRVIGMYQKMAVQDLMSTFAIRPFTALGMSQAESQVTLAYARQALGDTRVHRYFHYFFWTAQKPR